MKCGNTNKQFVLKVILIDRDRDRYDFFALIKRHRALAWTSTTISVIIGCLLRQNVCLLTFFTSIDVCCFSLWIFYGFTPALCCIRTNIFFAFLLRNLFFFSSLSLSFCILVAAKIFAAHEACTMCKYAKCSEFPFGK